MLYENLQYYWARLAAKKLRSCLGSQEARDVPSSLEHYYWCKLCAMHSLYTYFHVQLRMCQHSSDNCTSKVFICLPACQCRHFFLRDTSINTYHNLVCCDSFKKKKYIAFSKHFMCLLCSYLVRSLCKLFFRDDPGERSAGLTNPPRAGFLKLWFLYNFCTRNVKNIK